MYMPFLDKKKDFNQRLHPIKLAMEPSGSSIFITVLITVVDKLSTAENALTCLNDACIFLVNQNSLKSPTAKASYKHTVYTSLGALMFRHLNF